MNGSQDSVSGLNRWHAQFSSADQPSAKQSDLFHSMLHSQPGKCTKDNPYGWAGDRIETKPGKADTPPGGTCKIKDGKVSCDSKTGFERKAEGSLDEYHGKHVDTSLGKGEAGIKGDASLKSGFSGDVHVKVTAAEGTIKSSGNGAETSATVTSMMAGVKLAGQLGTGGIGGSACAEAEIVKGSAKGSVPLPYTGYKATAEASVGAGGAFCGEAKAGKDGVKFGTTLGLGPVFGGSIGVEPSK